MAFEIADKDLLGRIGKLKTKRGVIETPILLPVVNPLVQPITPREMERKYGCQAIIANAYLLKRNFGDKVKTLGIHNFLGFDRVIMTDSGAYQILLYGKVDVGPLEIARFQEEVDTDIAVILDVPTGWNITRKKAAYTVEETIRRARLTIKALIRRDILWVGPIQGGNHLDLLVYSASEVGGMPFQITALGSPTQVMERYLFDVLVDMVMTAKKSLPLQKPLHLFGAGHPFMFSLIVSMGCDMFDSAAYAIYSRQDKYMTVYGTMRLQDIDYFPCSCDICRKHTPKDLRELPSRDRERLLAEHNLQTCLKEIKRIKQAIREGRLWELLELRSRSHPSLLNALKRLRRYQRVIEAHAPLSKSRGIFFFDYLDLARPQILRHKLKLLKWRPPKQSTVLVLLPQPASKPFHRSREFKRILKHAQNMQTDIGKLHICFYTAPFGIVPLELDEVYPLSQFEASLPLDRETDEYVSNQVRNYILNGDHGCKAIVLHSVENTFGRRILKECEEACSKIGIKIYSSKVKEKPWSKESVENLISKVLIAIENREIKAREI